MLFPLLFSSWHLLLSRVLHGWGIEFTPIKQSLARAVSREAMHVEIEGILSSPILHTRQLFCTSFPSSTHYFEHVEESLHFFEYNFPSFWVILLFFHFFQSPILKPRHLCQISYCRVERIHSLTRSWDWPNSLRLKHIMTVGRNSDFVQTSWLTHTEHGLKQPLVRCQRCFGWCQRSSSLPLICSAMYQFIRLWCE